MVLVSVSGIVYTSAKLTKNTNFHSQSHVYLFIVHIYTQLRMVAQKAL